MILFILFSFIFHTPTPFALCDTPFIEITFDETNDAFNIMVPIGSNTRQNFFDINLKSHITFTSPFYFNKQNSDSIQTLTPLTQCYIYNPQQQIPSQLLSDYFYFQNEYLNITDVHFYHLNSNNDIYDSFSFNPTPLSQHHSLTHLLYASHRIRKLQFTLLFHGAKGSIFFGETPELIYNKYPHNTTIPIKPNSTFWEFQLLGTQVQIANTKQYKTLKHNAQRSSVVFQTTHKEIYAPKNVMKYLNETFFLPRVKTKQCEYIYYERTFTCNCDAVVSFPNIRFILNHNYTIYTISHYNYYDDFMTITQCRFLLRENKADVDSWEIGTAILSEHAYTFNYVEQHVTFHSKTAFIHASPAEMINDTTHHAQQLLLVNTLLLALTTTFIFFVSTRNTYITHIHLTLINK